MKRKEVLRSRILAALTVLTLLLSVASTALAADLSVVWQAPITGRFKVNQGFSVTTGTFVPLADADVVMTDKYLVGLNGTVIQQAGTDFGAIFKVPTDGYADNAMIRMDKAYIVRTADGVYAKICMCGTYYMGMSGESYYTEYGATVAIQLQKKPAPQPQPPQPQPQPEPQPQPQPQPPQPQPEPHPHHPQPQPQLSTGDALQFKLQGKGVELTWSNYAGSNDGYYVFRREEGGNYDTPAQDFPAMDYRFLDGSVEYGKTYYYVVRPYVGGQYGQTSNEVKVTVTETKQTRSVKLQLNNQTAEVNGKTVKLEVPPQLINDRTMVPLRFVAEALGADLNWDGAERKITLTSGSRNVQLWVDRKSAKVDGADKDLDVPPTLVNGRTLVPLRFISERLGAELQWDGATKTIELSVGGSAPAPQPEPQPEPTPEPEQPAPAKNPYVGFYVGLRVPGTAYVTDFAWSSVLTISPGVMTSGTLLISPDGTYAWNSSWDGKLIQGQWTEESEGIKLWKAQEGKNWTVRRSTATMGGDIFIWDGNIWYIADKER